MKIIEKLIIEWLPKGISIKEIKDEGANYNVVLVKEIKGNKKPMAAINLSKDEVKEALGEMLKTRYDYAIKTLTK